MLRLEKAKKSGEVNIRLRNRERFLNPVFCTAFGIALFMHLFAVAIFHIQPFLPESLWVFPSVRVQSEPMISISLDNGMVFADVEQNKILTPSFQPPPPSKFEMPPIPEMSSERYLGLLDEIKTPPEPSFFPELIHLSPQFSFHCNSFKIGVSGRLAEKELIQQPQPDKMSLKSPCLEKYSAHYAVKVDESTGKIFWMKKVESTKRPELDQKAEAILASLAFKPDPKQYETGGEVEITFATP